MQTHQVRVAPPPPAAVASAPLSPAAVAARAAQQPNPRPVIHVTIDRIDVRPAASPQPPAPPARRGSSAPRVSLSEYLRAGTGRPGGAP